MGEQIVDIPAASHGFSGGLRFLPQDRVSRSGLRCRSLTFQFLVVEGDTLVFMVFSQNRVLQRLLLSRLPTFLLLEFFVAFFQDRVLQRLVPSRPSSFLLVEVPHGFLPGQVSTSSPGPDQVDEHLPTLPSGCSSVPPPRKPHYWNTRTNATAWKPPSLGW